MNRAAQWTICCRWQGRAARVDASASGRSTVVQSFLPAGGDLAGVVGELLALARPGRSLLVVDDELATLQIALEAAAVAGLQRDALGCALAFEAEANSGGSSGGVRTGFVELPTGERSKRCFWVAQVGQTTLTALQQRAASHRSRLVGCVSTTGLFALASPIACVEVGEQVTFCSDGRGAGDVIAARAGQKYWAQQISAWRQRAGTGTVAWAGVARPPAEWDKVEDLGALPGTASEEAASAWLSELPALLTGAIDTRVPVVRPERRRWRLAAPRVAVVLSLLVAVVAWVDDARLRAALQKTNEQIDSGRLALHQRRERTEQNRRRLLEDETAAQARTLEESTWHSIDDLWQRQRTYLVEALRNIATQRPDGVQVRGIEPSGTGGLRVQGVAVDPAAVDRFAARLSASLRSRGTRVRPAESAMEQRGGVDIATFSIVVEAEGAQAPAPQAQKVRRPS